jgi:hypothetical protein
MRPSLLLLAASLATSAIAAPLHLSHQGRLFDSTGGAIDGPHDLSIALYDAPATGNVLWSDSMTAVDFSMGYYAIDIGGGATLSASAFDGDDVWMALAIDGAPALTRVKLATSAASADTATSVSGGVVNASELRINGTPVIDSSGDLIALSGGSLSDLSCTIGQVPTYGGAAWGCGPALPTHTHSASDIDSGTLAIGRLPIGFSGTDVAAGDHNHALPNLTGVLDAGQIPTAAVALASGSTVNSVAISTVDHNHALSGGTGVLDAVQMPIAAVDLAIASTVDGAAIATADDVTAAIGGIAQHHFTGSITVGGDADTYYPVCVSKPSEATQLVCDVRVFRRYSHPAPSTWNTATHKGGLAFWLQSSCGSAWSGQPKTTHLKWFAETYSTMVAKYTTPIHGCSATCIYLRGGSAFYSFEGNFTGIQTPTAYMDPAGTRDMCSPPTPGYSEPMETPVTTVTLSHVGLN